MRRFLLLLLFINQISNATTYYVAKNGNDRNNGVTLPFLTIQRGVNALKAGDTLFVRDGVYTERIVISDHNSTANSPIVISAFRGERPVIDGAGLDLGGNGNGLVSIFSPYVRFNGFEVRNVDMTGRYTDHMAVYLNGNDILSNCIVHNAYHGGVQICGNNNLMEYCTVYDCSMYNADLRIKNGNSAGVSIRGFPSRSITANYNTIRNCTIYNVYGETVSAVYTRNTVMEDNVVRQGGIYICNSQHGLYQRNFVFILNDMGEFRHAAIGCDNEYSGNTNSDNIIINNICYGAWSNFSATNLTNSTIANNTFVNSRYDWNVIIYRGFTHSNSNFVNNIVIQESSAPCIFYDGSDGIRFSNNLWNKLPSNNLEGGYARSNSDVISASSISKSGSVTSPDYFRLFQGSPAIDAGINLLSSDFEKNQRVNSDIGAFEFISGTPEPVSPVYVSSSVENATPSRLDITFSLSLAGIIPAASAFTVMVNSSPRSVTSVAVSGTRVSLGLSGAVAHGDVVTVAYTRPSSNPLQTPSGGQAGSFTARQVSNKVSAPPAPEPAYVSSSVENATPSRLDITFSLSLAGIIPAASAFTVMLNSSPRSVTSVAVSGTRVSLGLSGAVAHGDVVTVAYTRPSSNPLQTPSGGQAGSFTARQVSNKVAKVNNKPLVSINSPNDVFSGFIYELNAKESHDPDNDRLTFRWTVPSNLSVSSTTEPVLKFLAPVVSAPTQAQFTLKVSDGISSVSKNVIIEVIPYRPELETAEIVNIEASSHYAQNYPYNIIDGNIGTMWASNGNGQWLVIELKEPFNIQHIKLAFQPLQKKQFFFDIFGSSNNKSWEPIFLKSASCGFSGDLHVYDFPPSKAEKEYKFIKIVGLGNSSDEWNYFAELKILGYRNRIFLEYDKLPVKLFPNPAGEKVTIRIDDITFMPDFVKIMNFSGSLMLIKNVDPGIREFDINFNLHEGLYIVHFISGSVTLFSQKLIVQNK